MHANDVHDLAACLHALLPSTTLGLVPWDPVQQYQVADQLTAACELAGLTDKDATVIADTLAGYLGHWGSRRGNLDEAIEQAQQALTLALGQEVSVQAIAQMLGWVLLVELEEEPPDASP